MRRRRRVSSCTLIAPMSGRVTERGPSSPETDRGPLARPRLRDLVPHAERTALGVLLLEPRVPHSPPGALAPARVGPRPQGSAEVDHGLLEDLRGHFRPPSKARDLQLRSTRAVDDEPATGVLGLLPRVERVDQVEPRPRHPGRVDLVGHGRRGGAHGGSAGVQVQAHALVEREPSSALVPRQHTRLLHGGVSHPLERRIPDHDQQSYRWAPTRTGSLSPGHEDSADSYDRTKPPSPRTRRSSPSPRSAYYSDGSTASTVRQA